MTFNTFFFERIVIAITEPIFDNPAMNDFAARRAFTTVQMVHVSTLTTEVTLASRGMTEQQAPEAHFPSSSFLTSTPNSHLLRYFKYI
jgi:hypothetical protein